jgi:hypothetical protein
MRAVIAPILITVGSWLITTSAVLVLALAYVWSRHEGRRRRAREMVCLLLRRDQPPQIADRPLRKGGASSGGRPHRNRRRG